MSVHAACCAAARRQRHPRYDRTVQAYLHALSRWSFADRLFRVDVVLARRWRTCRLMWLRTARF